MKRSQRAPLFLKSGRIGRRRHKSRAVRFAARRDLLLEAFEPRIVLTGIPELIDLNPTGASNPADFVQVGATVFFAAEDGVAGRELWKTDGTPGGTARVRDIRPGAEPSNPTELVAFNGVLYFVADDGEVGQELWRSDGTESGTVLVRDLNPGEGYQYPYGEGQLRSKPAGLVVVNGQLVFSAEDSISGNELWGSEGTASGTQLIRDIAEGTFTNSFGTYPYGSDPRDLTVSNGTLFFSADDGVNGRELWKSDGTAAGTVLVKDVFTGSSPYYYDGNYYGDYPNSSNPTQLTAANGMLFFAANNGTLGRELWKSDGTEAGTVLVKDIEPGGGDSLYGDNSLVAANGKLFFAAETSTQGKELWSSDGTGTGTVLVRDIRPGTVGSLTDAYLTELNGELFFAADDGVNGTELWKSDGTQAGTVLVSNLDGTSVASAPRYLTTVNGLLYFSAFDSAHGRELWESDGTAAGTQLVADVLPGTSGSAPRDLFGFEQTLLYSADNGTAGRELFAAAAIGDSLSARLTIYVDGQPITIPANIGVDAGGTPISQVRTVGANGTLLVEPIADEPLSAITLDDFFTTWRTNAGQAGNNPDATFDATELFGNSVDMTNSIQMFVNGEISSAYEDYQLRDGDEIILVYGENPVVSLNTNFGALVIELFAGATPGTVDNFLNYVNDGRYLNSFFHRSDPGFVIQGGGFKTTSTTFTSTSQFSSVPTDPPIQNEPGISNLRGTVAMAKLGGNPNSATSQFFVNLSDDNDFLDLPQNNAFTAFGQVLDMTVPDRIADLPVDKTNPSPYNELPVSTDDQLVVVQSLAGVGHVSGTKFFDANSNGALDASDVLLAGITVYVDQNENGNFDVGEMFTTTDTAGQYRLQLEPGTYSLRSLVTDGRLESVPSATDGYEIDVQIGRELDARDFGEAVLAPPTSIDLAAAFDTGVADDDDLTNRNNATAASALQFVAGGVIDGATVRIFADGVLIGQATAVGSTATVTTDGTTVLADGLRSVTATQVFEGSESQPSAAISITIDTAIPPGITNSTSYVTRFGEPFTVDFDSPDEGQVTYAVTNAPTGVTIDGQTGVLSWTPTLQQAVPNTFDVVVRNAAGNTKATALEVTVLGTIPAQPDVYQVNEDSALNVSAAEGVLTNDGQAGTGALSAVLIDDVSHGTLSFNADGSFSYTPAANFFGTDRFTYQAGDGVIETNVAQVTITVNEVDDPVTPVEDSYTIAEDSVLTVSAEAGVLANDLDPDSDELVVSLANQPTSGTLQLNADGSFSYTPNLNFAGMDSFAYRVSDGTTTSEPVAVEITVTAVDDVPTAADDTYTVNEDSVLSVTVANGVLANDSDPDGTLSASLSVSPSHGAVTLNADGSFTYTPSANFAGTDQFGYTVTDGTNSSTAQATITVVGQPDPPQAVDDNFEAPDDGAVQTFNVLANDIVAPDLSDTLEIISVTQGTQGGTVQIVGGVINYAAPVGLSGTDTFTYTVEDTDGLTDTATVTVTLTDSVGNSISGFVYLDSDGDRLKDAGESGVPGTLITLTGTSNTGESISRSVITTNSGLYRFDNLAAGTYVVTESQPAALADGQESSGLTSATVGNDRISNLVVAGGQSLSDNNFGESRIHVEYVSIMWFFASSTAPSTVFREMVAIGEERAGNMELAQAIRAESESPVPEPGNSAPLASADAYSIGEATTLNVSAANGVLANDTDADQDSLSAALVSTTTHGTLILNSDGSFSYTPDNGFVGSDSFSYTASDGTELSNTANVTLTVEDTANTFSIQENSATGSVVGQVQLGASGTLSFALNDTSLPADLSLRPDDHLTGDPAAPLVLIEYVDFQCPICKTFEPLVEGLKEEFTEELLIVRRHLPINPPHTNALAAAVASEAAALQGKFDEMGALLFEKQDEWGIDADPTPFFVSYADQLDLDVTQFLQDFSNPALTTRVQRDADAAARLGATATPTFYLNGSRLDNGEAQADFEAVIDEALADFDEPFLIDRTTGQIIVANGNRLDFESQSRYELTVAGTNSAGVTSTVEVVINLVNVNEAAPVAFADSYTVAENTTLTINVASGLLSNDSDADGDSLIAVRQTDPTHGALALNADGSFTYQPDAGFSGTDSFTYQASDSTRTSSTATVTLTVTGQNDPPVATNDTYLVTEGTPLTIPVAGGVLDNDQDPDGDAITAELATTTSHGTLQLNADGSFSYTPDAEFNGNDSFTYRASDGSLTSALATVALTVSAVNDPPQAVNDSYATSENTALVVPLAEGVLANDDDLDGDSLTTQLITGPAHGTLTLEPDGSFTYTPDSDFSGTDSFTYQARDAASSSNTATATVAVAAVNDLPQAVGKSYVTTQGATLEVAAADGVLSNDVDPDNDPLTATLVGDVSHGTLTLNPDGSFRYIPATGFSGSDSFTYEASDGTGASNVATITLTVNPANTFSLLENAANGSLVGQLQLLNADLNGELIFEVVDPALPSELKLTADDHLAGDLAAPVVLIEYLDFECPPCAVYHPIVQQLRDDFAGELLVVRRHFPLTSIHPNAFAAGVAAEAAGRQGKFDEMADLLFQNQADWSSEAQPTPKFESYANDLGLDPTQFATDLADPSLAARVQRDSDAATSLGLTGTPSFYLQGERLTNLPATQAAFDSVIQAAVDQVDDPFAVNRRTGQIDVRNNQDLEFDNNPSFTRNVRVTDLDGDTETLLATINLIRVNEHQPVALLDTYQVDEDSQLTVVTSEGILANDTDADGDLLFPRVETNPQNGTLVLNMDGSFTYTPNGNFSGSDSFTYQAADGDFLSETAVVTIKVNNLNDPPVAVDDSFTVEESAILRPEASTGVLANDQDLDGDSLQAEVVAPPTNGSLVLNPDGSFTYVPVASFSGSDSFTYRAIDPAGTSSDIATVSLTVTDVNQAPVAADDAYVLQANNTLAVAAVEGVLANDTDPDGDSLVPIVMTQPAHGTLLLAADGTLSYTPENDFDGSDSFTYRVNDGILDSAIATVRFTINPANTFNLDENSIAGTSVGVVQPKSAQVGSPRVFEFADANLDPLLQLVPDDHLSGDVQAPVVLIEYLDFQCPACRAYHPLVQQLKQDFAGELLVVSRHFPLTQVHPKAIEAGIAAEAAGRQGQFDAMGDLLFQNQDEWKAAENSQALFVSYAGQLGLDTTQFVSDLADPALAARVQRDLDATVSLGLSATPSFFLDGTQLTDLPGNLAEFQNVIQAQVDQVDHVFTLDRLTGELTVRDSDALDFESTPVFTLDVRATDLEGDTETFEVTVKLNNLVDQPEGAVLSSPWIDEAIANHEDWRLPS